MMSKRVTIKDIARELSYAVIICQSHKDRVREEINIPTLISNNVAGIVMSLS
jgi:DNA-binding LacI/PurR family transcriptional regulator